ncbi:HSP20 family protein [Deinobacterium chartae]|uniref:HSP20 family protein n=1 Tax=Deinobacterium chartae TaxID=521158 RepID=A0A841HZZ0_9DEIO|nr:Hsp20/alpha crystallin family protein [Deinobacterium chartae]MBB6097770.1 HSP20 family protein [Deinobacterium chartae]
MMRFDPFREIEELQQRVDQMFRQSLGSGNAPARFAPLADVSEDDRGLEVTIDLPGIPTEDISIEAENNTLTVQAERKLPQTEGKTRHRVERPYGSFVRTFSVPAKYDLGKIEAYHQNGTLTLLIPRSEAAQKRSISIRSAQPALENNRTVDAGAISS